MTARAARSTVPPAVALPLRAVHYYRQSLDWEQTGLAVSRQKAECRQLSTSRNYVVVAEFEEVVSASNGRRRPRWEQVLALIASGAVDVVVSYHLDRITRGLADLETLITAAVDHNVSIATCTGEMDLSTDTGRLIARILASVARAEVERKSARQRLANLQRADLGAAYAGPIPLGYRRYRRTDKEQLLTYEIVEREAALVRQAYRDVIRGESLSKIRRDWAAAGVKTSRGKPYSLTGVRDFLRAPRNAGLRSYHGRIIADAWPAIVDRQTWDAVQAILDDPARLTRTAPNTAANLLSGLVDCEKCGEGLSAKRRKDGRTANYVMTEIYTCKRRCTSARRAPADALATKIVLARLCREDAHELLRAGETDADPAALMARIDLLRQKQTTLSAEFVADRITAAALRDATETLRVEIEQLKVRAAAGQDAAILAPLILADDIEATWADLPLARQRAVVALVLVITAKVCGSGRSWTTDYLDFQDRAEVEAEAARAPGEAA